MKFKSEESINYRCIAQDKVCVGKSCAGWVEDTVIIPAVLEERNFPNPPKILRPSIVANTDLGYCGLIKQ